MLMKTWTASVVHVCGLVLLTIDRDRRVWVTWSFADQVNDIHTEAIDAFVEPKLHGAAHLTHNLWIVPIDIGLLLAKQM